jgi:hypothetical protein
MIRLAELRDEAALVFAERRDSLEQQLTAIARRERNVSFTAAEIEKRSKRLPRLEALASGMAQLEARRADLPDWILAAFEGGKNG